MLLPRDIIYNDARHRGRRHAAIKNAEYSAAHNSTSTMMPPIPVISDDAGKEAFNSLISTLNTPSLQREACRDTRAAPILPHSRNTTNAEISLHGFISMPISGAPPLMAL